MNQEYFEVPEAVFISVLSLALVVMGGKGCKLQIDTGSLVTNPIRFGYNTTTDR